MLKKVIILFTFFTFMNSYLYAQRNLQDVVYLKDGSIIRGIIIEQVPSVSLKIQTRDGSVFFLRMDKILKMTKERYFRFNEKVAQYKSPGLAFFMSFLIPGVGQYYNGQVNKGIAQEVLYIGGWVFALAVGKVYNYDYNHHRSIETTPAMYIGLGLAGVSYLWSMIDAPISASKINRRVAQNYGHMTEFNQGKNVLGFDMGPMRKGFAAKLSYHF